MYLFHWSNHQLWTLYFLSFHLQICAEMKTMDRLPHTLHSLVENANFSLSLTKGTMNPGKTFEEIVVFHHWCLHFSNTCCLLNNFVVLKVWTNFFVRIVHFWISMHDGLIEIISFLSRNQVTKFAKLWCWQYCSCWLALCFVFPPFNWLGIFWRSSYYDLSKVAIVHFSLINRKPLILECVYITHSSRRHGIFSKKISEIFQQEK